MSLKLACPRCHHVQFFTDALAGQPVTCAKCAQPFRVPQPVAPAEQPSVPAAVPWPWPGQMQARELPASFAASEPAPLKAVQLPDQPPTASPSPDWDSDISKSGSAGSGTRRGPRSIGTRPRPLRHEPTKAPWVFGVAGVAFVLLFFIVTATWFLLREPPPRVQAKAQQPFQFQPQFGQQPMQPMPGPPGGQPLPPFGQPQEWNWPKGQRAPVAPQPNEQPITLKLVKGRLKVRGNLGANDPTDPLMANHHRKVYLVELDANRKYTIEMNMDPPRRLLQPNRENFGQGFALDPFLRLEDSQGLILDWNDDIVPVQNQDSRIEKVMPAKGQYRIIATSFAPNQTGKFTLTIRDDDMGQPVAAKPLADLPKLPEPSAPKQPLNAEKTAKRNLTITTLLKSESPWIGDLCWSADGKAFFALDEAGTLRRIVLGEPPVEEKRLVLNPSASGLAMAQPGLLVALNSLEEVWVLDPETLAVRRRISAPGVQRVVAAPVSSVAFIAAKLKADPPKDVFRPQMGVPVEPVLRDLIVVLDLAKGIPTRQYDFPPHLAAVSPDGKFLFAQGGIDQLMRYRIQGDELALDEAGPRIGQGQGIFVSPDSKYVCLSCKLGNNVKAVNPPAQLYTTFIYAAQKLSVPAFSIVTGAAPMAIGFDSQAGVVFASNHDKQFLVFSETGLKIQEESLPGADRFSGAPRQFLTHQGGFRVLVRTERTLYQVDLPNDEEQ